VNGRAIAQLCALLAAPVAVIAAPCRLEEGQTLLATGKTSLARPILEECATGESPNPLAAFSLGQAYLFDHDEDRAVLWLERAAALDDRRAEYQLWLGRAYGQQALHASPLRQPGLARKVRRAFERAVELDRDMLSARMALVEYGLRAPAFLGGSVAKARGQAEEIRRRDSLQGHRAFGVIAEHEKRYDVAALEYENAIREFPDTSDPVFWRVDLAERQKDYALALDLLERLAGTDRSEPEVLYRIGALAASSGQRLDRGRECLKRYLEHEPSGDEPSLALAHRQLGAIYERLKDRELARREYAMALELDPTLNEAREALAQK
jgi:tetratricopeptide (TPR) repeat protein